MAVLIEFKEMEGYQGDYTVILNLEYTPIEFQQYIKEKMKKDGEVVLENDREKAWFDEMIDLHQVMPPVMVTDWIPVWGK